MTKKKADETEQLSFEEALARLETIIEHIEQGEIGLDESVARYEEGMKLLGTCRAKLEAAEKRIEQIEKAARGEGAEEEAEDED